MFAIAYTRHVLGRHLAEVNPVFEKLAREQGFYTEESMNRIARTGSARTDRRFPGTCAPRSQPRWTSPPSGNCASRLPCGAMWTPPCRRRSAFPPPRPPAMSARSSSRPGTPGSRASPSTGTGANPAGRVLVDAAIDGQLGPEQFVAAQMMRLMLVPDRSRGCWPARIGAGDRAIVLVPVGVAQRAVVVVSTVGQQLVHLGPADQPPYPPGPARRIAATSQSMTRPKTGANSSAARSAASSRPGGRCQNPRPLARRPPPGDAGAVTPPIGSR